MRGKRLLGSLLVCAALAGAASCVAGAAAKLPTTPAAMLGVLNSYRSHAGLAQWQPDAAIRRAAAKALAPDPCRSHPTSGGSGCVSVDRCGGYASAAPKVVTCHVQAALTGLRVHGTRFSWSMEKNDQPAKTLTVLERQARQAPAGRIGLAHVARLGAHHNVWLFIVVD